MVFYFVPFVSFVVNFLCRKKDLTVKILVLIHC